MTTKQNHKRWRLSFNSSCLNRDKNKCVFCGAKNNLDVHHITDRHDMPNGGYATTNGITVCDDHHLKCEESIELEYSSEELYKIINSSYSIAYKDSQNLK